MSTVPEWAVLQLRLREQIKQTVCKYQEAYPKPIVGEEAADAHGSEIMDSTTILLPYIAYARWAGDSATRAWLYEWRDAYASVMRGNRAGFFHGFPEKGEAHHQWEDQSRFLSRLWFLDRRDPVNAYVVDDAAEHIGNWSPDVPAWYDWEQHDFISYWFGTKHVAHRGGYPGPIWGTATPTPPTGIYREALYRVAQTAFNAYFATGKARYLDWTRDFMDGYIRRLETLGEQEDLIRTFAKVGWPEPDQTDYFRDNGWPKPTNRFCYGRYVPMLLTDLYALTGETKYADAARTFLDFCMPDALDFWHQHWTFGILQRYRHVTGDTRYDAAVMQAIEAECATTGEFDPCAYPWEMTGLQAMAHSRNRGPLAHILQYWITGDETYAVKALRQAEGLAGELLDRPVEEFVEGFATSHIAFIVDMKLVNTLLDLGGWRPGVPAHHIDVLDVVVSDAEGREGLPPDVALLRKPSPLSSRVFALYNAGTEPRTLRLAAGGWRYRHLERARVNGADCPLDTAPAREMASQTVTITLPAHAVTEVEMEVSPLAFGL
ncbi:MAG TPA: hypothetical protein VFB21_04945 [Chthonomonadaceae bacterium]|nr:hypothetical protein [Chthonomonadaceae bacterium]